MKELMDAHLRYVFVHSAAADEIAVLTGWLKGAKINGLFDVSTRTQALGAHRDTVSKTSSFYCQSVAAQGLESGDEIEYKGRVYTVELLHEDLHGVTRVDFLTRL